VSVAVYPGSFDPITNGHLDIVKRGAKIFDHLVIAVADNPARQTLFTKEERVEMIKEVCKSFKNVSVDAFDGLVVEYVRRKKANVILRGIRTISDFEYEYQMALTNRTFAQDIETVFVMTSEEFSFVSSKLIKEAASLGGDIGSLVPKEAERWVKKKLSEGTKARKKD